MVSLKDIKPPMTIEYTRHSDNRGSLIRRVLVIEKRGRNLRINDMGSEDWLWWPTVNHYGDVQIIESEKPEETEITEL